MNSPYLLSLCVNNINTVKIMAMWRTVIRSGNVVPAMKAMVPANAILNKNPDYINILLISVNKSAM